MHKKIDRCIYCGAKKKLTGEHIFGRWIKPYLTPGSPRTQHFTSSIRLDPVTGAGVPLVGKGRLDRPGAPHSHQLPIVCLDCNRGWMSQIQEDAKPILIELFHGRWPEMTEQTRMAIASWATMVTMNLELADRATKATNQEDRYKFMSQRSPLDNWQVLVGLCQAQMEPGSFWHRAAAFLEGNTSEAIPSEPNTQTSTFFFGNCFIHTISGPKQFLPLPTDYAAQLGIRQIFPLGNSRTDKPMVFTGMGVSRVAVHFWVGHGLSPEPHMGLIDHLG